MHFTPLSCHSHCLPLLRFWRFHPMQFDLNVSPQPCQQPCDPDQLSCNKSVNPARAPCAAAGLLSSCLCLLASLLLNRQAQCIDLGNLFERLSQSLNIPSELIMTADENVAVVNLTAGCRPANAWLIATYWPQSLRSLASRVVMMMRRMGKERAMWSQSQMGGLSQRRQAAWLTLWWATSNRMNCQLLMTYTSCRSSSIALTLCTFPHLNNLPFVTYLTRIEMNKWNSCLLPTSMQKCCLLHT